MYIFIMLSISLKITEKSFLVGIDNINYKSLWSATQSLDELIQLAQTAGLEVACHGYQKIKQINPKTYIGHGKVEEIKKIIIQKNIKVVIFDDELTPSQQRNLEIIFGENVKVIDRTALILDIFAQHAHTREGQIQVELAQYEYRLPRLTRLWSHLTRQTGGRSGGIKGGVGLRGPGETQLETDRRLIQKKIRHLKKELERVRRERHNRRRQRRRKGLKVIALAGYTNTGKSTLLNALSQAHILAEDKFFATLDPVTRRVRLLSGQEVLFTDTVGFIRKLPHNLVAAFRATLEGIVEADVILHIADISHTMAFAQVASAEHVLKEQGAFNKPVLLVWNKADSVSSDRIKAVQNNSSSLVISAKTGYGLKQLFIKLEQVLKEDLKQVEMLLPFHAGRFINAIIKRGILTSLKHTDSGTLINAHIPEILYAKLEEFIL